MSQMEIDRVLSQIRALRDQATVGTQTKLAPDAVHGPSFAAVLRQGLDSVSAVQNRAGDVATAFERGTPGVDLPQVMLEMQKANVAFRATVEVRNKLVNAYQEIMNMPV
jgi:flagellar hook-basal body complex protein FliE